MRETILQRQTRHQGRIFNVETMQVRLPDGQEGYREVVRHPGAVALIVIDAAQRVLLVRQYRIAADQITLELPAGTLEPDEDPLPAAVRELQEEAGYKPTELDHIGGIYPAPGYNTEFIHFYHVRAYEASALEADEDEFIEVVWLPLSEALDRIEAGEISDSKTVAGLLRVARRLGV